jgi:hypothetical protein
MIMQEGNKLNYISPSPVYPNWYFIRRFKIYTDLFLDVDSPIQEHATFFA